MKPAVKSIEPPQCEGDHFFENRCNACGGSQPDGMCAICPHMPFTYGPNGIEQNDTKAEHFARRPCCHCGSSNLRTVRVHRGSLLKSAAPGVNDEIEIIDDNNFAWGRIRVTERAPISLRITKASIFLSPDQLDVIAEECRALAAILRSRR
jgi:hypothetical protein